MTRDIPRRVIPNPVPAGHYLWHNHIYPVQRYAGPNGSRFYLRDALDDTLEPCDCGWAPEVGTHYRIVIAS